MQRISQTLTILAIIVSAQSIRVCQNFDDYYDYNNTNCYDNPDENANVTDIIGRWGFKANEHKIITEDGYILSLFKINSRNKKSDPILLSHGLVNNCLSFINRGHKSLAYVFVKNGYDVWLLNFRGTRFSREHLNLTINDLEFWDFSFHEMASQDLRAIVKYMYKETNKKIIYVGFSLGTAISYVYADLYAYEAKNMLLGIVSLAPIAFLKNTNPLMMFLHPFVPVVSPVAKLLFKGEAFPRFNLVYLCSKSPVMMKICSMLIGTVAGINLEQIDPTTFPVTIIQNVDAVAVEVIVHYHQILETSNFQFYDHGKIFNQLVYRQIEPPLYNLTRIPVPVIMFASWNDWIAYPDNAKMIYDELHPDVQCGFNLIPDKNFAHLDFIIAKDAERILYDDLLKSVTYLKGGICLKNTTNEFDNFIN